MYFFESFLSFPNEIDKKEQIKVFYWLIINSFGQEGSWQKHRGL